MIDSGIGIARTRTAERDHGLARLIAGEALPRQQPLFFTGEQHRPCIAQHAVFTPRPVQTLLEVLEWKLTLEPRIQHAVGIYKIRRHGAVQFAVYSQPVVLPQPVDDHRLVLPVMGAQPRTQQG